MAFIRTPNAAPLPGDVRLAAGRLERFDTATDWSPDAVAFQGPWNEWTDYTSGDVVENLHGALPGLWVCTDPEADTWSMLAWPTRGDE
jgi:hypothetical protein